MLMISGLFLEWLLPSRHASYAGESLAADGLVSVVPSS